MLRNTMSLWPAPLTGPNPIDADRSQAGCRDNDVVPDVVDLALPGEGVAQHHVGHGIAVEIAEAGNLRTGEERAQHGGTGDVVVADIVDLELLAVGVAQHHVAGVGAVEAAEAGFAAAIEADANGLRIAVG